MNARLIQLLAIAMIASFARAIPLPEHPRPDFNRPDWINLNGTWEFGFKAGTYDKSIQVPFGWGSPLSGVSDEGDTGHYRRTVTIPAEWKGKRVFVIVGAADHDTTCRFEGENLGLHRGGYTPFEYELTEFVRWGEAQTLEFDVWDPPPETARAGHYLYGKQGYGNARGIWQTVYLEARGETYFERVTFTSQLDKKSVTATILLSAPAKGDALISLALDGRTHEVPVVAGQMVATKEIPLAEPKLWDLEHPYLYDVTLTYASSAKDAGASDVLATYFGFREIGVGKTPNGDAYMTLNGKPVYLQLTLDQSYHPQGWYTFPSDEFMKNEIMISKRLALTGNRVHIKVEVPRKLYWADKLGLLIQADVPCAWGDASLQMFEEHWACFEDMLKRDFNHPCIYQWTLFNETWGLFSNRSLTMGLAGGSGGKKRTYRDWTKRKVAEAYLKAKVADPTRLIEDNSPCNRDHVITDVNTWHAYRAGYDWEKTVAKACNETKVGSHANYAAGFVQTGVPMMNSECGNVWGYKGSTGDCDFTWDYHVMINAFRRHLSCGGWLYTEHHDVCNEWNGYVRFDRSPKYTGLDELAGMSLNDFHAPAVIYFAGRLGSEIGETVSAGATVQLPVGVSFVTDVYAGKTLALSRRMWYYDGEGRKIESPVTSLSGAPVAKSWQCETLWTDAFALPAGPAAGVVIYVLKANGSEIARNFWSFSTVSAKAEQVKPVRSNWSVGTAEVMGGLKVNGFGKGSFEYELSAPANGGVFRVELSAKRQNGKDMKEKMQKGGLDWMLGGGSSDRSKNPNSYPQTSDVKFPANLEVMVNGERALARVLPDDPADHRGILSWLAQPRDRTLHEAGSYGWLVEVPVPAAAVKNGKVAVRLSSDAGLAVYGPRFGRYPFGPHVGER